MDGAAWQSVEKRSTREARTPRSPSESTSASCPCQNSARLQHIEMVSQLCNPPQYMRRHSSASNHHNAYGVTALQETTTIHTASQPCKKPPQHIRCHSSASTTICTMLNYSQTQKVELCKVGTTFLTCIAATTKVPMACRKDTCILRLLWGCQHLVVMLLQPAFSIRASSFNSSAGHNPCAMVFASRLYHTTSSHCTIGNKHLPVNNKHLPVF
jgi:hypothetical protein